MGVIADTDTDKDQELLSWAGGLNTRPHDDDELLSWAKGLSPSDIALSSSKGSWWTPERIDQAVNHLQTHANLSPMGAQGLVSRWANVEAKGGPNSVNPNSGAVGIGQWLGNRKNGVPGDFEGQLNHAVRELNGSESAAARRLRTARTPEEAATGASMYERAEGYDPATGRDNFVNATIRGMGHQPTTPATSYDPKQIDDLLAKSAPTEADTPSLLKNIDGLLQQSAPAGLATGPGKIGGGMPTSPTVPGVQTVQSVQPPLSTSGKPMMSPGDGGLAPTQAPTPEIQSSPKEPTPIQSDTIPNQPVDAAGPPQPSLVPAVQPPVPSTAHVPAVESQDIFAPKAGVNPTPDMIPAPAPRPTAPVATDDDVKQYLAYKGLPDTPQSRQQFAKDLATAGPGNITSSINPADYSTTAGQKLSELEQETPTADGGTVRFSREVGKPTDDPTGIVGTYRAPAGMSAKNAAIAALTNVGGRYNLTPQQAQAHVANLAKGGSSFVLGKYDPANGGEVKVDWQTLQNAGVDVNATRRMEQAQNSEAVQTGPDNGQFVGQVTNKDGERVGSDDFQGSTLQQIRGLSPDEVRQENDPLYRQAVNNIGQDGGTQQDIENEYLRLQSNQKINEREIIEKGKKQGYDWSQILKLPAGGVNLGPIAGAAEEVGSATLSGVSGFLHVINQLPRATFIGDSRDQSVTDKLETWMHNLAKGMGAFAETEKEQNPNIVSSLMRFGPSTVGHLGRLAVLSRLPGGEYTAFTADSALPSVDRNRGINGEVFKDAGIGLGFSLIFKGADKLGDAIKNGVLKRLLSPTDIEAINAGALDVLPKDAPGYLRAARSNFIAEVGGSAARLATITGGSYALTDAAGEKDPAAQTAVMVGLDMLTNAAKLGKLGRLSKQIWRVAPELPTEKPRDLMLLAEGGDKLAVYDVTGKFPDDVITGVVGKNIVPPDADRTAFAPREMPGTVPIPMAGTVQYPKPKSATWRNADYDQPVKVTGEAGTHNGETYYTLENSKTAVPASELEFEGNGKNASIQPSKPVISTNTDKVTPTLTSIDPLDRIDALQEAGHIDAKKTKQLLKSLDTEPDAAMQRIAELETAAGIGPAAVGSGSPQKNLKSETTNLKPDQEQTTDRPTSSDSPNANAAKVEKEAIAAEPVSEPSAVQNNAVAPDSTPKRPVNRMIVEPYPSLSLDREKGEEGPKEPWQMTRREYEHPASIYDQMIEAIGGQENLGKPHTKEQQAELDKLSKELEEEGSRSKEQRDRVTAWLQKKFPDEARRLDYHEIAPDKMHRALVEMALEEGKPVPTKVLSEYPNLVTKQESTGIATDAAHDAATSPMNDLPEPTQPQKEAGNYQKGHIKINGLDISVENPVGSQRTGVDRDGKEWSTVMAHHYGYIKRTVGADEEHIDVFVKDKTPADYAGPVYVVDQVHPDSGKFDEHKVLLGFDSEKEARDAYAANYAKDWKGLKSITEMPFNEFKGWVKNGKKNQPRASDTSGEALSEFKVDPDDIPYKLAYSAHQYSSFSPEKRAEDVRRDYVKHVTDVYEKLRSIAKTDEQKALLATEIERYRKGYIDRETAILSAQSRTASSMITGSANFPVERNRRRMETVDKRTNEFLEWDKKAQDAIEKKLLDSRPPEIKADERWQGFKADIDRSIEWHSPTNLAGRLETLANNGDVELLNKSLDYIREKQKDSPKVLFTDRHSVWKLPEKAEAEASAAAPTGTIATYDGATVVNNKEQARIQILFDEKPSGDTINLLKKNGWRWSPSNNAWQRQNTQNGINNAGYVLKQAGVEKIKDAGTERVDDGVPIEPTGVKPEPKVAENVAKAPHEMTAAEYKAAFPKENDGAIVTGHDGNEYTINEGKSGKWWTENNKTKEVTAFRSQADMRDSLYGHSSHHKALGKAVREGVAVDPEILSEYPQLERIQNKQKADRVFKFQADDRASEILGQIAAEGKAAVPAATVKELRTIAEKHDLSPSEVDRLVNTADTGYRRRLAKGTDVPAEGSRPPVGPVLEGKETLIRIPGEAKAYKAKYVLRLLSDVQASHNAFNFNPNPEYWYKNDRHYDKQVGYQASVVQDSQPNKFQPEQVINNAPTAEMGPTVIDSDGNSLGGNSRLLKLNRIFASDNPKAKNAYIAKLKEEAPAFGMTAADVSKFGNEPFGLFREITESGIDKQAAITDFNKVSAKDLSASEAAVAAGGNISENALNTIADEMDRMGGNASVTDMLNAHGPEVVQALIKDGVFNENQRNTLVQHGKITDLGKQKVKQLLLGKVFDDLEQLEYAPASVKNNIERVIVPLIKTQRAADWDILPQVREAIDLLTEHAAKGGKDSLDTFVRQTSLVKPEGWSPEALAIAKTLKSDYPVAPFKVYAGEFKNAETGSMFGSLTPEEAFDEAFIKKSGGPVSLRSVGKLDKDVEDRLAFRKEIDSIKPVRNDDGELLAPNGKVSNLQTEQLWKTVRTKAFKNYFGDWELQQKNVPIIEVRRHTFSNLADAEKWAKGHLIGDYKNVDQQVKISISNAAIGKYLHAKATNKSTNLGEHLAVLKELPRLIETSVLGETHRDNDGTPRVNAIQRFYGAVRVNDETRRVKLTVKAYDTGRNKAYSYEVTDIETLGGDVQKGLASVDAAKASDSTPSVSLGTLLQGARKNNGESFEASKVVDENGEPLVVYHGGHVLHGDEFMMSEEGFNGVFLHPDASVAYDYATQYAAKYAKIYPLFASIKNPVHQEDLPPGIVRRNQVEGIKYAREHGYDGLQWEGTTLKNGRTPEDTIVAFSSSQLKAVGPASNGALDYDGFQDYRFEARSNSGAFDPNESNILKNVRTDEEAEYLHKELPVAHLADITDRATGGELNDKGELRMAPEDGELVRRFHGEVEAQRAGREIEAQPFDGITIDAGTLRQMASVGRQAAEEMKLNGYPAQNVANVAKLAENLDQLAERAKDYGIAYVFDDALPEERFHQKDLRAGRTDGQAEATIENQSKLYQDPGPVFDSEYGRANRADKISELIAKLATDQQAKYGWDKMPDFEAERDKIRKLWADGVIRNNLDADGNLNVDLLKFEEVFKYAYFKAGEVGVEAHNQRPDTEPGSEGNRELATSGGDSKRSLADDEGRAGGGETSGGGAIEPGGTGETIDTGIRSDLGSETDKSNDSGAVRDEQSGEKGHPEQKDVSGLDRGVSKIGKSIEAKTIEAGLIRNGFDETAGYDKKTRADQSAIISKLINSDYDKAYAMALGFEGIPSNISPILLHTAFEDIALERGDTQALQNLANSPIVSESSLHAQELQFARFREPDSAAAVIQEVRKAKIAKIKKLLNGRTIDQALKEQAEKIEPLVDAVAGDKQHEDTNQRVKNLTQQANELKALLSDEHARTRELLEKTQDMGRQQSETNKLLKRTQAAVDYYKMMTEMPLLRPQAGGKKSAATAPSAPVERTGRTSKELIRRRDEIRAERPKLEELIRNAFKPVRSDGVTLRMAAPFGEKRLTSLEPDVEDALIKLSELKLIDDMPKGMAVEDFDDWLRQTTNGNIDQRDIEAIHAEAYRLTRPSTPQTLTADEKNAIQTRLEHSRRAKRVLNADKIKQRKAERNQAAESLKNKDAFRYDKFAKQLLKNAEDIEATPQGVFVAFALRETPHTSDVKAAYDAANPERQTWDDFKRDNPALVEADNTEAYKQYKRENPSFSDAVEEGRTLLNLTKDQIKKKVEESEKGIDAVGKEKAAQKTSSSKFNSLDPKLRDQILSQIDKVYHVLSLVDKKAISRNVAAQQLGVNVDDDTIQKIIDLTERLKDAKSKVIDEEGNFTKQRKVGEVATQDEIDYGQAAIDLESYVASLKMQEGDPSMLKDVGSFIWNLPMRFLTYGHGGVIPFTHARSSAYTPGEATIFSRTVGRAYSYLPKKGGDIRHSRDMADLRSDPMYNFMVKSGLKISVGAEPIGMGTSRWTNKSFDALKGMRRDLFRKYWNQQAENNQTPEMAKSIANVINHATGEAATPEPINRILGKTMFAPKLRVAKYVGTFVDPFTSKLGASRMGKMIALCLGLLAINDLVNRYFFGKTGDDTVNWIDPSKADWLRMKVAGMTVPMSPMFEMARLPFRVGADVLSSDPRHDKWKTVESEVASAAHPALGHGIGLLTGKEAWSGKTLPFPGVSQLVTGVDKRSKDYALNKYEYASDFTPIPLQPILKETAKNGFPLDAKLAPIVVESILSGLFGTHAYEAIPRHDKEAADNPVTQARSGAITKTAADAKLKQQLDTGELTRKQYLNRLKGVELTSDAAKAKMMHAQTDSDFAEIENFLKEVKPPDQANIRSIMQKKVINLRTDGSVKARTNADKLQALVDKYVPLSK